MKIKCQCDRLVRRGRGNPTGDGAGNKLAPARDGVFEKAADVFGTGVRMDDLGIDESLDYSAASFNYNIESQLDNTTNNTYTMVLAKVRVMTDGQGNLVAAN